MITIESNTCTGCGLCVEDCVCRSIALNQGKAVFIGPNCILCGHCTAICPTHSVTLTAPGYAKTDVVDFKPEDYHVDPGHLLGLMRMRRTCRSFTKEPVSPEDLNDLLLAARYGATGSNKQGVHYTVIQENLPSIREEIWDALLSITPKENDPNHLWDKYQASKSGEEDRLLFHAPCMIIVTADRDIDGGIACSHIELLAEAKGLGSIYCGFAERGIKGVPALQKRLGISTPPAFLVCISLGHPVHHYQRTAARKELSVNYL